MLTIAGDGGNIETLRTTDEHPFWVQGKGWTIAGELALGDFVQEADGSWQEVTGSERIAHADGVQVFNFEVQGDHTYFVADAEASVSDPVWVHNKCVGDKFVARMSKKSVLFTGVPVSTKRFRKVGDTSALQAAATGPKNEFVRDLGRRAQTDPVLAKQLTDAGVHPTEFVSMAAGTRPTGFQVHHRQPLEWGGTNDQANFVLMRNQPYHRAITVEQDALAGHVPAGKEFEVEWPDFPGPIFGGFAP